MRGRWKAAVRRSFIPAKAAAAAAMWVWVGMGIGEGDEKIVRSEERRVGKECRN